MTKAEGKKEDKREHFSGGKILEVRESDGEGQGIVTAYLTKWDTVDSYRTMFKRGSFERSFREKGPEGLRLIFNHDQLAGKITEVREDDYGPRATVKFNLGTTAGRDAYEHVRHGDVDCFSFGFNTIDDRWNAGVREITDIDLFECGPVVFQANDDAKITGVRATDFAETQRIRELNGRGWQLLYSLEVTLDDIYFQGREVAPDTIITQVDTAIAEFHSQYMEWIREYYGFFEERSDGNLENTRNALRTEVRNMDTEALVKNSSLTQDEVDTMVKGDLLNREGRTKLKEADEKLYKVHQQTRSAAIEQLCDELRMGDFNTGEKDRVQALLALSEPPTNQLAGLVGFVKDLRKNINRGKE